MKPLIEERQYDDVIAFLDRLTDEGAMEDGSPLSDLFQKAFDLAYEYEQRVYPLPPISDAVVRRFLMEQHSLHSWQLGPLSVDDR